MGKRKKEEGRNREVYTCYNFSKYCINIVQVWVLCICTPSQVVFRTWRGRREKSGGKKVGGGRDRGGR